jgi:hypothetical protein
MTLTDDKTVKLVGFAVLAMAVIGFAMGVTQSQKPVAEPQPLPIPTPQAHVMNMESVPNATALDPNSATADPSLAKPKAKPVEEPEDQGDDQPDAATSQVQQAPAPAAPHETPAKDPAASAPAPTQHGPF